MNWTAGYASELEYIPGFYREQSPTHLNLACVLNGVTPVDTALPFTYLELGFGRGLSLNTLAAANPNGDFYGIDFNPAHVAGARQLAQAASLENVTLLERSFEALALQEDADIPECDFITLHGIYTWVTAENQQHIIAIINRYLKPGGIVYVSYNALPGTCPTLPLQRMMVDHAALQHLPSDGRIRAATDFMERLSRQPIGYFGSTPGMHAKL
jgi:predicted O-methyltransferase YrrM